MSSQAGQSACLYPISLKGSGQNPTCREAGSPLRSLLLQLETGHYPLSASLAQTLKRVVLSYTAV